MRRTDAHRTWLVYFGGDSLAMALGWTLAPVYFVRVVHMTPLELVLTGTALEVAYFLFEVPTGVVADTYSRRTSVIFAEVVIGVGFIVTGVFASVPVILAAAALMGFGWTFKSGADDAWLADEVGLDNVGRSYQRGAQVGRVLSLAGVAAAVLLALVDLRLAVIGGGVAFLLLALVLGATMPETGFRPAPRQSLSAARAMAATARDGGRLIRARPILLLIIGITFFSGMSSEAYDRLWEAHLLRDVGVPGFAGLSAVVWFGVLTAGTTLLAIAVAQPLVRRLERLDRRAMARVLLALDALLILGLLAFAFAGVFALAVAAFWVVGVTRSLGRPVYSTWLNTNVEDSRIRATVISMVSLGDAVGEAGGGPMLGGIGNAFGIRAALGAGAAALSPALWLYGRAIRHHGREPELEELPQAVEARA